MKKLALLTSKNDCKIEAITNRFQGSNVEITVISEIENPMLREKAEKLQLGYELLPALKNADYFSQNEFDLIALLGYEPILQDDVLDKMGKVINVHHSLLPSFKGENPVQQAFLTGVKVSGITIYYFSKSGNEPKIITQYPVFLENSMRLDEFEEAIITIENKLYPIVIEKIIEDKVFDFQDLMKSSCDNKSCGGCSSDSKSGGCSGCKEK